MLCNHNIVGLLSKSRGQVLRVAAIFHTLFSIDERRYSDSTDASDRDPDEITDDAIIAAIDFVKTACQHTMYIAGRGTLEEGVKRAQEGKYILLSGAQ